MVAEVLSTARFTVPDGFAILWGRCPECGGNVCASFGEIRCLWCARSLHPEIVSATGRILQLSTQWVAPRLSRAGRMESRRIHRSLAREQGTTGRAARILRHIPHPPDRIGISKIAKLLSISSPEAREAMDTLVAQGLVVCETYGDGHGYVGYHLVARELQEA